MKYPSEGHRNVDTYSIRAVERAVRVLACFSFQKNEHTMRELAQMAKLSKSTVFRILQTLEKHKFVAHDSQSGRYLLGMKLFELGGIVFYHRNLTQNERLRKEVDLLRNRLSTGLEVYLENERLKNLLSFKQASPYRLMAARVIGRSPDSWSCSIIIDKGKNSGIRDGMAAVNFFGLVGRVIEAGKYTSKILLLNDPGLGVSGLIQRSRQEGLVCGTLGAHLLMKYLPEESDIKAQDTVITSGLNSAYPKGLLIGKDIDIGKEFSGIGRFAIIKPAVNLSNIEEVLIIIE